MIMQSNKIIIKLKFFPFKKHFSRQAPFFSSPPPPFFSRALYVSLRLTLFPLAALFLRSLCVSPGPFLLPSYYSPHFSPARFLVFLRANPFFSAPPFSLTPPLLLRPPASNSGTVTVMHQFSHTIKLYINGNSA